MTTQENVSQKDDDKKVQILACFKIVHDLDTVLEQDWANPVNRTVDVSYTRRMIGNYDEAALEMALQVADQIRASGKDVKVTALCIGSENHEAICKNLYAVKFDRVIFMNCFKDLRFCPEETAKKIASVVEHEGGYDLIFMGQQTSEGDNGAVYWMTAELLGIPVVSEIIDAEIQEEKILVISETENWERRYLCEFPLVCAVGNSRHPYLRVATLREKLASSKKGIEYIGEENSGNVFLREKLKMLQRPEVYKKCLRIDGETTRQRAEVLYHALKDAGVLEVQE